MARLIKKLSTAAGLPPGSLVHIGKRATDNVMITVFDYDEAQYQELVIQNVEECFPFKTKPSFSWINVDGLHDTAMIEKIGDHFGLHPLVLEDIVNTGQRPKMEDFDDYIFIVTKMLFFDEEQQEISMDQVSLILGENYVISFQEKPGDVFEPIRERIRRSKGRVRQARSGYLTYALLDSIVDGYFILLENLGEKIERLEETLLEKPTPETLKTIQRLKRDLIFLRKSVWPLKEVINDLERGGSHLFHESTITYLRDVFDHTIQVAETIESYREMLASMRDTYLSSISNKTNEVMKVLTIIATIFIPLTFITGIYGMNFQFIPELGWRWSYFAALAMMAAVALIMIAYFKKKDWL